MPNEPPDLRTLSPRQVVDEAFRNAGAEPMIAEVSIILRPVPLAVLLREARQFYQECGEPVPDYVNEGIAQAEAATDQK